MDYNNTLEFNETGKPSSFIKVIGVGGGGGNAVNHMYGEGIDDVNFAIFNTDYQDLVKSKIPVKLQLGKQLTNGLGAGGNPEKGRLAAEESKEDIKDILKADNTKMVFVTAGMGGGTGTGAAPVIAREAKAMGILTVGIVTIPFLFEGTRKIDQALDGVEEIAKHVDALLVINNERLREIYPDLNVLSAFERADNTLSVAARSIAEIITMHGVINLDFRDVCTVLKDGGVAIMSTGYGEGDNRVTAAIQDALHSPLLNSNDIFNSKKVLLSISFCAENEGDTLMMEEMNEVHEFMGKFRDDVETKWGLSIDPSLGKKVKITILATGFGITNVPGIREKMNQEEQERQRELEEKAEENNERREQFYGTSERGSGTKKRPKVYLFGLEDLDNEEVISMVEITPTYKRTKEQLNDIKAKVGDGTVAIEAEASEYIDMSSSIAFLP